MKPAVNKISRGFTLVELLVALTILSLISGMMFGSLRVGVTIAEKVDWQVSRSQRIHLVQRTLRKQLQQAMPVLKTGQLADGSLDFAASSNQVTFVAPLTFGAVHGSLHRVSLSILDDPGQFTGAKKLVLRFRLLVPDDDFRFPGYETREYIVLDQFVDAEFAFLGAAGHGDMQWQDEWSEDHEIPNLIRLRIRYLDGDVTTWPDLVVSPRMTSVSDSDNS
jgi:general secretion pathway protein J